MLCLAWLLPVRQRRGCTWAAPSVLLPMLPCGVSGALLMLGEPLLIRLRVAEATCFA